MKRLAIALLLLIPAAAFAATAVETYVAARDGYIKKLQQLEKRGEPEESLRKQHAGALADLERQLQRIVGPAALKGVSATGKINLETLSRDDQGFGMLDGLVHASADDKTRVLVTTDALFRHWLREHKNWSPQGSNMPQEFGEALQSELFYTQAISTDAAVIRYAELPITKPAQASVAFAMLNARAQDIGPGTPNEIIVSVMRGARLFVVTAQAEAAIEPMPACDAIWKEAVRKSDEVFEAYSRSDPKDETLLNRQTEIVEQGDAAFHRCFAERAKNDAAFPRLLKQAQAIADALPEK